MGYEVHLEQVSPRSLAVVTCSASRATLGATIVGSLDRVWPVVRAQGLRTGHNVVVYHGGLARLEVGVEVFGELAETPDVRRSSTPAGVAVTVAHFGDYAAVRPAYAAIERSGYRLASTSWEVYGDWSADPRQQRMDVYWLVASQVD